MDYATDPTELRGTRFPTIDLIPSFPGNGPPDPDSDTQIPSPLLQLSHEKTRPDTFHEILDG